MIELEEPALRCLTAHAPGLPVWGAFFIYGAQLNSKVILCSGGIQMKIKNLIILIIAVIVLGVSIGCHPAGDDRRTPPPTKDAPPDDSRPPVRGEPVTPGVPPPGP